jgi:hypothetical protein
VKVLILYRPNSEHARAVESFIRDFQTAHTSDKLQVIDVDSREGSATASLYDIMQHPAVLALREDGSILKSWEGETLPLMNEIAYYTFSAG